MTAVACRTPRRLRAVLAAVLLAAGVLASCENEPNYTPGRWTYSTAR